jgi:hypothetical protein
MPLERSASIEFRGGIRMVKWRRNFIRTWKRGVRVLALLWLAVPLAGAAAVEPEAELPSEPVSLDRLLTLPAVLPIESSERAGLTRVEWSNRFEEADEEVTAAEADLEESLDKLSELVGKTSNWKVAAPGLAAGAPSDNSPVDYGLKQEIKRKRENVVLAERKRRNLIVEANLAGVPEDWYKPARSPE